jgi:hypothetical protein
VELVAEVVVFTTKASPAGLPSAPKRWPNTPQPEPSALPLSCHTIT